MNVSQFAVRCGNCRCEFDARSFTACPSCGAQASEAMQLAFLAQQQRQMSANTYQRQYGQQFGQQYSNQTQMNQLQQQSGIALQQMQQMQSTGLANHLAQKMEKQGIKPYDFVPELDEYEKKVRAHVSRVSQITLKEGKMGLFSAFLKKKELELEIKKLAEELDHSKRQEEMRIAEAVQKQRLKTNEETAALKIECEQKVKTAQSDATAQLKQASADKQLALTEQAAKHAKDLSALEKKYAEDYYAKLSDALTDLHKNGDKNSAFIQNLALEMIKKTPKLLPGQAKVKVTGKLKDIDVG